MSWLWPWVFVLLPLPWLLRRLLPPVGERRNPAITAPFAGDWQAVDSTQRQRKTGGGRVSLVLLWLIWIAMLCAVARPQWIGEAIEIPTSGRDLMLAVDLSGSMRTPDMVVGNRAVRRIDAVQQLGAEFIERRKGDRIGLILFGSNAYVQSPLSMDSKTVAQLLSEARLGFAGEQTAIGDAIGLAVKRLKERPAENRVLILISDGADTASAISPAEATRLAATFGVRIYTVGIGADRMTVPGRFGLGSREVNPSLELDEEGLTRIATRTGGRYFRARDPRDLMQIYQLLDELEPIERDSKVYRPRQSLSHLPIALGVLLGLLLGLWQLYLRGSFRLTVAGRSMGEAS